MEVFETSESEKLTLPKSRDAEAQALLTSCLLNQANCAIKLSEWQVSALAHAGPRSGVSRPSWQHVPCAPTVADCST